MSNTKFIVKNITSRPLTISDLTTYGITIAPGKKFDLASLADLSQIGRSKDVQAAIRSGYLKVFDQREREITDKTLATGYVGRTVVDTALDSITGGTGSGTVGNQGYQGFQASVGYQGIQGAQGFSGIQGYQGFQSSVGFQGTQGAQGLSGIQGFQGFQGLQSSIGVQGSQGFQGAQGFSGIQGHQGSQGWQGPIGLQGVQGFQGLQGWQGFSGIQGFQGAQGWQGLIGLQGAQGVQGFQGFQGLIGLQGVQGFQGFQGWQGSQGFQGWQGLSGIQGNQGLSPNAVTIDTDQEISGLKTFTNADGIQFLDAGSSVYVSSGELTFEDAVTGPLKLSELSVPMYIFLKATTQSEGDLHLSDGTNWNTSKAIIKHIRVYTSSTDWELWILQNDNGYATDDANIQKRLIATNRSGDAYLDIEMLYEDEDATNEVHLYYNDTSGTNTADIIIQGIKAR